MSAPNRPAGRDVHIYDASDPTTTVLGGLTLTNGVTNASFYPMVEIMIVVIIFIFDRDYFLRDEGGTTIQRDNHPLQPGNYYIATSGRFLIRLPVVVERFWNRVTGSSKVLSLCVSE